MGTLSISFHRWRRLKVGYDLVMWFLVLGFVTLGASRDILQDKLIELRETLRRLRGDRQP